MGKIKAIPTDPILYNEIKEIVKNRVAVWPSAYASGQLVRDYKRIFAEKYGVHENPYLTQKPNKQITGNLDRWYKEVWVNVCEKDKNGKYIPCGRSKADMNPSNYPYCRPTYRISTNTPKTISEFNAKELYEMCKYKRSKPQGIKNKPTRIYHKKILE